MAMGYLLQLFQTSKLFRGICVWLPAFLSLELPAHFWKACPWPTLSGTVWLGIKGWHPVSYFVTIALVILWGHFDEHWSVGWLIGVGASLALAVGIHLATR